MSTVTFIDVVNAKNATGSHPPIMGAPGLVRGDAAILTPNSVQFPSTVLPISGGSDWSLIYWVNTVVADHLRMEGTSSSPGDPAAIVTDFDGEFHASDESHDISSSGFPWAPGRHMVAVTYVNSTTTGSLYVDGGLEGTDPAIFFLQPVSGWDINAEIGGSSPAFVLDELAFFTSALSGGDISSLFSLKNSFSSYSSAVLALSPDSYYHFDEIPSGGWHVGHIGIGG